MMAWVMAYAMYRHEQEDKQQALQKDALILDASVTGAAELLFFVYSGYQSNWVFLKHHSYRTELKNQPNWLAQFWATPLWRLVRACLLGASAVAMSGFKSGDDVAKSTLLSFANALLKIAHDSGLLGLSEQDDFSSLYPIARVFVFVVFQVVFPGRCTRLRRRMSTASNCFVVFSRICSGSFRR
jgi:hypothetical protein